MGERYGFRIESGRAGPRGNERLQRLFARLDAIHTAEPLDAILVTGDITDAGRSAEWAELFAALAPYPRLAESMLILPGNHDINVVDRANPARLEMPFSPNKRLREARVISAMAAFQTARLHLVDRARKTLGPTLDEALAPHRAAIAAFADKGSLRLSRPVAELWTQLFPLVRPPQAADGLGIILLNSNADTHFSFTNALGLVSADEMRGVEIACSLFPSARWLIGLHHHTSEYPRPVKQLSERIGTALINGTWFVRRLQQIAPGAVVMHGHRHIDWIGECGGLRIVSAPSQVMNSTDDRATYFYIHTLARGSKSRFLNSCRRSGSRFRVSERMLQLFPAPPAQKLRHEISLIGRRQIRRSSCLALRAGQNLGNPPAGRILLAKRQDRDHDRHTDEGAGDAPQKAPQKNREQH